MKSFDEQLVQEMRSQSYRVGWLKAEVQITRNAMQSALSALGHQKRFETTRNMLRRRIESADSTASIIAAADEFGILP